MILTDPRNPDAVRFQRELEKWHDLRRARPVRRARAGGVSRSA